MNKIKLRPLNGATFEIIDGELFIYFDSKGGSIDTADIVIYDDTTKNGHYDGGVLRMTKNGNLTIKTI